MPPVPLTVRVREGWLWVQPHTGSRNPSLTSPRQPVLLPGWRAHHFSKLHAPFVGLTYLLHDLEHTPPLWSLGFGFLLCGMSGWIS